MSFSMITCSRRSYGDLVDTRSKLVQTSDVTSLPTKVRVAAVGPGHLWGHGSPL